MKKGFTLIEILGVISLVGILALIAFPIINGVVDNSKEKMYLRQIKTIKEVATKYMVENSNLLPVENEEYILTFEQLKQSSHLENKTIIDPRTEEEIIGCFYIIYDENSNKYIYELQLGDMCDQG